MRIHQRQGDLYPDDDETYEDFMDRCTDEIGDEDVCQLIWDDRGAKDVCHKTHASKVAGLEFVLSDESDCDQCDPTRHPDDRGAR